MRTSTCPLLLSLAVLALGLQPLLTAAESPTISPGGVVNAADYTPALAPGVIFSIFGSDLAPSVAVATTVPLPDSLAGVNVEVVSGGVARRAPLFFVSPGQINAQLPFGPFSGPVLVRVRTTTGLSNEEPITVSTAAPRLFTRTMDGLGEAILVHQDYSLVSAEHPARAGEWVVLSLTGLGAVDPPVAAGSPGGLDPLSWAQGSREVFVNGEPANVYFAGLAPNFVGLYQVNFQIPETAAAGMAELVVRLAGESSQDAVRFGCSVAYAETATQTLGPAGGAVSSGGLEVEIPAGGLSSSTPITLYNVTGATPLAPGSTDLIHAVGGLPEGYTGTLTATVTIPGDPSSPGSGALVMMTESGAGSETVLETTIQGNTATATIDFAAGPAAPKSANTRRAANVLDAANAGLALLQFVRGLHQAESPSHHFLLHYNSTMFSDALAGNTAASLDQAEQQLLAFGFSWPAGTTYPIAATISSQLGSLFEGSPGSTKWNAATGQWTLRIDGATAGASPDAARTARLVSLLARSFADQIDTTIRLDAMVQSTPWLWWHTAVGEALAQRSLVSSGVPNPWYYGWAPLFADFLYKNPLQYPGASVAVGVAGSYPVGRHGLGASLFVHHLAEQRGGANWIPEVYASWSPSKTPVEVLGGVGFNVGTEWLEFCRKMSLGEYNFEPHPFANSAQVMARAAARNRISLSSKEAFPASYTWSATDLSAHVVRYDLNYAFADDEKLIIKLPQGGPAAAARIFRDTTTIGTATPEFLGEIGAGESLEIANPAAYTGSALVIMLINARAVKPFDGVTPIQLLLDLKAGEDSKIVSLLKQCKRISIWLGGLEPQCTDASGKDTGCGFMGMMMTNVDSLREQLVEIQWEGRTFHYAGTIYYPTSMNDTVQIAGSGTVSEDGLTIESAQFYQKDIGTKSGTEVIREMQVSGIPYDGYPPAFPRSGYSYKARAAAVGAAIEIMKYNEYTNGKLYKTMSSYGFASSAGLDLSFWRDQ